MEDNERNDKDTVTDIMAQLSGQPTMAVGEYLGPDGFFRKLDEAVTKARYDNVAAHIQNVVNVIGKAPRLSPVQIIKIRSWSNVASDIPPTDEARSAIIEAALHDILKLAEASPYEEAANELNSYPNISETLRASTVDQKFNRYAAAIDNLRNELSINPNPLDVNSASALKPFQDEVENSLKDLAMWASQTRDFADKQINELSKAVKQP